MMKKTTNPFEKLSIMLKDAKTIAEA